MIRSKTTTTGFVGVFLLLNGESKAHYVFFLNQSSFSLAAFDRSQIDTSLPPSSLGSPGSQHNGPRRCIGFVPRGNFLCGRESQEQCCPCQPPCTVFALARGSSEPGTIAVRP